MDYFDFPSLPLLVQELITNEIVHNHTSDTWINFASCSKSTNELVRRARPKKIIDHLRIGLFTGPGFHCRFNNVEKFKTVEELIEILQQCQINTLELYEDYIFMDPQILELFDILCESSKFLTELTISRCHVEGKFLDFYQNLEYLDYLTCRVDCWTLQNLPHFPSKLKIERVVFNDVVGWFLPHLAEKTEHCPLKFFHLDGHVSKLQLQTFLQTAKFMKDAEIYFECTTSNLNYIKVFLTYVGENLFEIQMFPFANDTFAVNHVMIKNNKRVIEIKLVETNQPPFDPMGEKFNVTSASSAGQIIYSNIHTRFQRYFKVENIDENDWIK
uniref:DUF38 domain-containing protein n=1 Tax=Panagrolaimus sp. JU765 TaxID=591449 RepID=A0AC34Q038_9BILA